MRYQKPKKVSRALQPVTPESLALERFYFCFWLFLLILVLVVKSL